VILIAFAFYVIFIRQYETMTTLQASYATLVVFLGILPGLIVLLNKQEAELIPLMPMHGLFYALTFGLPVISNKIQMLSPEPNFPGFDRWVDARDDALTTALVLTIIGQICLYLGYYGFGKLYRKLKPIRVRDIPIQQQIIFSWFLFGCYLLLQLFPKLREMPSINQLSTPLAYISLGILALLALDRKLPGWQRVLFRIAQAFMLLNALLSGSLAPLVLLIVFFGVLYWANKKRIPWHLIALIVIIMVLLNPIKQQFRKHTWYADNKSTSIIEKTFLLGGVVGEHYADKPLLLEISKDKGLLNRAANISLFSYAVFSTPEFIPYWSGDSYRTLWTSFIPRILWPGKPQATIGQDFGHRYFLLNENDKGTSINLPWLIEFYINFGILGLLAGMFFVGVFFRVLLEKLKVPVRARMEYVLAVTITFSLFYAESNFALMVGGMLPTFLIFIILMRLLTRGPIINASDDSRHL
jgi:hypothetical protein